MKSFHFVGSLLFGILVYERFAHTSVKFLLYLKKMIRDVDIYIRLVIVEFVLN